MDQLGPSRSGVRVNSSASLTLNALERYRALIYRKGKGQAMDRPTLTAATH